jgi:hypothetical protein
MSWDSDLSTTRDRVRALVGDTNEAKEFFDDDHYDAVAALQSSFELYVAFIADELDAKLALRPEHVTLPNGLSVGYTRTNLRALAARMRATAAATTAKTAAMASTGVRVIAVW